MSAQPYSDVKDQLFAVTGIRGFSDDYKTSVFFIWFNAGKPNPKGLLSLIEPVPGTDVTPSVFILRDWIDNDFVNRAVDLDKQIVNDLVDATISSKIEMLKRHIELGKKMQNVALKFLEENASEMNANAAVRLLVEGIRVERESAGIPEALEKMTQMTDEQLLNEIGNIISKSPGTVEANNG